MSRAQSNVAPASSTSSSTQGMGDDQAIRARVTEFAAAWNKHDPRQMAACWAQDGDLITPFGRPAKGRLQIEQLFAEEQQGVMKDSTHQMNPNSVRILPGDLALVDADCVITGMRGADGNAAPVFKPHVFLVMGRKDGAWSFLAARPYAFIPKPDSV